MKKQMKWLLAALALAALATPAFAVTADMTGSLSVRGIMTNNFDVSNDAQDHAQFLDQRFRLFTSVAANENVKAVLGLEVDNTFGRVSSAQTPVAATNPVFGGAPAYTNKELGTMGTDSTSSLEVKHLYLDFKIPALGANVKAGSQAFNFGRGLIINDDAAGFLVTMPCQVMPNNILQLSWIKTDENTTGGVNQSKNDGDFYGIKYTLKSGDMTIAPYAGYYSAPQDNSVVLPAVAINNDLHAAFYGVDVDGKAGAFTYALTAISNSWSAGSNVDGGSVSLYGKGTFASGDNLFSLEAASYGDQDNGGEAMSLSQGYGTGTGPVNNFSEILTGGQYTSNSTGYANVGSAQNLYSANYQYLKVGAVHKINDSMKVSGYVMHIEQAEDTAPGASAITYGQEIDGYFDYTIVPGLGLNVALAYLMADNDLAAANQTADDAYKFATSLNYKF